MKHTYLLFLMTICLLAFSCNKEEVIPVTEILELSRLNSSSGLTYEESLDKWKALKKENGNHYLYQTAFQSFVGFGNITQIEVNNGQVISRKFEAYKFNDLSGKRETVGSYCEDAADLGTNNKGLAPLTIDELYEKCATDFASVDETQNISLFETADNGMMTICGYIPIFCVDDCFMGVQIDGFQWLD